MVNNVLSSLIEIIRELDKKSPIYSYTIYTIITSLNSKLYIVYESTIPLLQDKYATTMSLMLLF